MDTYGLRVKDTAGNVCLITPDVKNIVSSGTITMPSTLWSDNTYGVNVALPGTKAFNEEDIGVLVTVPKYLPTYQASWVAGLVPANHWAVAKWLIATQPFYTRDDDTGIMSDFTETLQRDTIFNFHPVAFWDKMGNTTFNVVRLFAGVIFYIYQYSTLTYQQVYHLAGIPSIDYVVFIRNI